MIKRKTPLAGNTHRSTLTNLGRFAWILTSKELGQLPADLKMDSEKNSRPYQHVKVTVLLSYDLFRAHSKATFKHVFLHVIMFCLKLIINFSKKKHWFLTKVQTTVKTPLIPLHGAVTAQRSTFSNRLLPSWCTRKRFCRSFLPAAIRVQNSAWVGSLASASVYQLSFFHSHFSPAVYNIGYFTESLIATYNYNNS